MLSREKMDRMLAAASYAEAAKLLAECGYEDLSESDAAGIDAALSQRRSAAFTELAGLAAQSEAVDIFRLKYDYHNIKTLVKAAGAGVAGERLLSLAPASLREDYRPYLMQEEGYTHRLVKAADRIAAYIKCVEERQAGNREFLAAEQTILQSIEAIDLPEVQAFFAQCVPAFGLSLDELSGGEVEP